MEYVFLRTIVIVTKVGLDKSVTLRLSVSVFLMMTQRLVVVMENVFNQIPVFAKKIGLV